MLKQILVGGGVFIICVAIHAWFSLWSVNVIGPRLQRQGTSLQLVSTMVAVVSLLAVAHVIEVCFWATAMALVDAIKAADGPLYFAFTSYTTLGYGDVAAEKEWNLLGPVSAMNGILLFGWSTATIFEVLQSVVLTRKTQNKKSKE